MKMNIKTFILRLLRRTKSLEQLEREDFLQDMRERGHFEGIDTVEYMSRKHDDKDDGIGGDSTAIADSEDSDYED